jgi:hypothetical protein
MLKLIISKFWPVLIPIIIFLIWQFFILPKIKTNKDKKALMAKYLLTVSILIILISSLLLFFLKESANKTRYYQPAKIEGGKIKPAILK